jgi:hypothetical protein
MKLIHRCIAASLAVVLSPVAAIAQQPAKPPAGEHERAKTPEPVTGEIVAVDDKAKTIVVKTDTASEMKFSYSDETEVVGGEKGPSGLAMASGTIVTVTYGVHGTTNVALKIEVKSKK